MDAVTLAGDAWLKYGTLRAASEATGVSASSLWRMAHGIGTPEDINVRRLEAALRGETMNGLTRAQRKTLEHMADGREYTAEQLPCSKHPTLSILVESGLVFEGWDTVQWKYSITDAGRKALAA